MILVLTLASQALFVQRAEVSLVPPEPLPLGGYTARQDAIFEPGGDDLKARTLLFTHGTTKVALVSLEMLTVPASFRDQVQKRIPADVNLLLVATHTHCAPDSQMLNSRMTFRIPGIAPFDRKWQAWFADQVASSINLALAADQKPIPSFELRQAQVSFNRGRREGASPDPTSTLLSWKGGGILSYSAHETVFDETRLKLTGDWPGAIMDSTPYLVLPGAIGDASPNADGADAQAKIKAMATGLKNAALASSPKSHKADLQFKTQTIELGQPKAHPEFAKTNNINDAIATILINRFAEPEASLTGLLLGETLFIGVPGEPTAELGKNIQAVAAEAGFKSTVIISHCNGWIGYILMPLDYDRGGYEATLALHGRDLSERIIAATKKLVAQFPPRAGQSLKLKSKTTRFMEDATSLATSCAF